MIKRSVILFMALLYLITAAGFDVNMHYCNNRIAGIQINSAAGTCAKPMAMGKSKMQCRDSHLTVKVKDDHQKESFSLYNWQTAIELPVSRIFDFLYHHGRSQPSAQAYRGPPDIRLTTIPLFLKNRIIRV